MSYLSAFSSATVLEIGAAYGAGLLSSLTPCVYPLIPITIALFACEDRPAARRTAFIRALCYVLGIAASYTALGVICAQTGALFGSIFQHLWVQAVGAALLVALALLTLEIIPPSVFAPLQNSASRVGGKGPVGLFLIGAMSGIVAAPCVGPVLVGLLSIAAASQNPAWGATLLFFYSLGLGTLFLVLGTFSGLLASLPRSGRWLGAVKVVLATGILYTALVFARPLVSPFVQGDTTLATIVCTLFTLAAWGIGARRQSARVIACGSFFAAAALYLPFGLPGSDPDRPFAAAAASSTQWSSSFDQGLQLARERNFLIVVDLWAEWCAACHELERQTFSHPEVKKQLTRFIPVRVDFTDDSDDSDRISERFKVIGLPTVLFLTPEGAEIPNSRITGFVPPDEFARHLAGLLAR